jgi:hypothetical protein
MITVTIETKLPDDKLLFAYLDWVRTFDKTHAGCHFRVFAEGGDQTMGEIWQMFERLGLDLKFAERNKEEPHGTSTKKT